MWQAIKGQGAQLGHRAEVKIVIFKPLFTYCHSATNRNKEGPGIFPPKEQHEARASERNTDGGTLSLLRRLKKKALDSLYGFGGEVEKEG